MHVNIPLPHSQRELLWCCASTQHPGSKAGGGSALLCCTSLATLRNTNSTKGCRAAAFPASLHQPSLRRMALKKISHRWDPLKCRLLPQTKWQVVQHFLKHKIFKVSLEEILTKTTKYHISHSAVQKLSSTSPPLVRAAPSAPSQLHAPQQGGDVLWIQPLQRNTTAATQ